MRLLRESQVVRGTYEVEKYLGEGAFAEVYRVKHRFLGRQAMKVFKVSGMTREEAQQVLGEAILLSHMGHPNVVRVFDADVAETDHGRCAFFTMEYVAGGTLLDFWKSHGSALMPVATAVEIMRQVCRGLAVAHEASPPIVHRDIKPQNILIGFDTSGLRARITDFGLARQVNPLTLLASAQGTLRFKGPEVFADPNSDSLAGDVWALGCTLYLLLTDRLPYGSVDETEYNPATLLATALDLPSSINPQVDAELDIIVRRALDPRPKRRYAGAPQMLAALEKWRPVTAAGRGKAALAGVDSKSALGPLATPDEVAARKLAETAVTLARVHCRLSEAADLMEEAITQSPRLRERYGAALQNWRKGIVM